MIEIDRKWSKTIETDRKCSKMIEIVEGVENRRKLSKLVENGSKMIEISQKRLGCSNCNSAEEEPIFTFLNKMSKIGEVALRPQDRKIKWIQ